MNDESLNLINSNAKQAIHGVMREFHSRKILSNKIWILLNKGDQAILKLELIFCQDVLYHQNHAL